jgi:hypothetical protein
MSRLVLRAYTLRLALNHAGAPCGEHERERMRMRIRVGP